MFKALSAVGSGLMFLVFSVSPVLNWCTFFPRTPGETTLDVTLSPTAGSGVFTQSDASAVVIYTPGNGEVMYGQMDFAFPLVVRGEVFYAGDLDDVSLTLEVISEGEVVDRAVERPSPDGSFVFDLVGNLGGLTPAIPQRSE
ncbi:MAG: hypothetical protein HGA84_02320, partial [Syntrophobacteraceae bacterium]|nr:hypothetical protein [Syntrophobacteraceae bacterium]